MRMGHESMMSTQGSDEDVMKSEKQSKQQSKTATMTRRRGDGSTEKQDMVDWRI